MGRAAWVGLLVGVALLGAAAWYLYGDGRLPSAAPPASPGEAAPAASAPAVEQGPRYPLPEPDAAATAEPAEPPAPPLPPLAQSDEAAQRALRELFAPAPLESWLIPKDVIRRIVVTVDNLPRDNLPLRSRPLRPVPGPMTATADAERMLLDPSANASRYAPLIELLDTVQPTAAAAFYKRYYPLFQDAYAELGYGSRHFNDRLVEVIDHLLATPDLQQPAELVRPKVLWQFADPALESRSAGQKALLRLGPEKALLAKSKLQQLRELIVPPPTSG